MNNLQLTPEMFIAQFPEFAPKPVANDEGNCCYCSPTEPINPNIEVMITRALNYVDVQCSFLPNNKKQYAIFLLTAHFLTKLKDILDGNTTGGVQTSASIDKVSVSIAPPPGSTSFEYAFNQTIYGQEFLAYLEMIMSTPSLVGGSFQRVLN